MEKEEEEPEKVETNLELSKSFQKASPQLKNLRPKMTKLFEDTEIESKNPETTPETKRNSKNTRKSCFKSSMMVLKNY